MRSQSSRQSTLYEHTFDEWNEYMFTSANLNRLTRFIIEDSVRITKQKERKQRKPIVNTLAVAPKEEWFTPRGRDQLFWCFYVAIEGIEKYNMIGHHKFQEEKEYKINTVAKLRGIKDKLKSKKVSLNVSENELVNASEIGATTIRALSALHELPIIYKIGNAFYNFSAETDKQAILIEKVDKNHKLYLGDAKPLCDKIIEGCFEIDPKKPMRGISTFTLGHLQNICLKLDIETQTDAGKPKLKRILYDEIIVKLGKLHEPV
jgi:hypothetical protein